MPKTNQDVEAVVQLYVETVASLEPFEAIRAVQVALWAESELGGVVSPSVVLGYLRRLTKRGYLMQTVSHTVHLEHNFYINPNKLREV